MLLDLMVSLMCYSGVTYNSIIRDTKRDKGVTSGPVWNLVHMAYVVSFTLIGKGKLDQHIRLLKSIPSFLD
jgi:hypothetical protein